MQRILFASLLAVVAGCAGYRFGSTALYRPDITTVHVPVFEADTFRRNLGERLTEAVVKRIEQQTPYKVVDLASADSVLSGRIMRVRKNVLAENANDEPRNLEAELLVQLSWTDRRGSYLMQPTSIPLPGVVLNVSQGANFIPEAGQSMATAQQEAMGRLAKQIVDQMEMPW